MGTDEGEQVIGEANLGDKGKDAADHQTVEGEEVDGEGAGWGDKEAAQMHGDAAEDGAQGDGDVVDHDAAGGDRLLAEDGDGPEFLTVANFLDEAAAEDKGHEAVVFPGVPPADGQADKEEEGGNGDVGPVLLDGFGEAVAVKVEDFFPVLAAGALINLAVAPGGKVTQVFDDGRADLLALGAGEVGADGAVKAGCLADLVAGEGFEAFFFGLGEERFERSPAGFASGYPSLHVHRLERLEEW